MFVFFSVDGVVFRRVHFDNMSEGPKKTESQTSLYVQLSHKKEKKVFFVKMTTKKLDESMMRDVQCGRHE